MHRPVGRVPKFVTARNPKRLRAVMLLTQAKLGYGVDFYDIQHVNGTWYAWYVDNDDVTKNTVEQEIGTISGRDDKR